MTSALPRDPLKPIERTSGRVLVVDAHERVLLLRGTDPGDPAAGDWWFTPGGGLEPGESLESGALRELREETGLALDALGPAVWVRTAHFRFMGRDYRQAETFFLVRVDLPAVDFGGHTAVEQESVHEFRWWPLAVLAASSVTVYPSVLAAELTLLLARPAGADWPGPKDVGS